jgi:outer membrane lipoprotein SlyB
MSISSRHTIGYAAAAAMLACAAGTALAQSSNVSYGRITAVSQGSASTPNSQPAGAIIGGSIGLISGSGHSGSNQALRAIGGAAAGRRIGAMAGSRPTFEYTVLLGGKTTIQVVTDEAGMRVGDCVSVERGNFNNLRLVDDARCDRPARATSSAVKEANACQQAKEALLAANTDADFDRAERRVRLLCSD